MSKGMDASLMLSFRGLGWRVRSALVLCLAPVASSLAVEPKSYSSYDDQSPPAPRADDARGEDRPDDAARAGLPEGSSGRHREVSRRLGAQRRRLRPGRGQQPRSLDRRLRRLPEAGAQDAARHSDSLRHRRRARPQQRDRRGDLPAPRRPGLHARSGTGGRSRPHHGRRRFAPPASSGRSPRASRCRATSAGAARTKASPKIPTWSPSSAKR